MRTVRVGDKNDEDNAEEFDDEDDGGDDGDEEDEEDEEEEEKGYDISESKRENNGKSSNMAAWQTRAKSDEFKVLPAKSMIRTPAKSSIEELARELVSEEVQKEKAQKESLRLSRLFSRI